MKKYLSVALAFVLTICMAGTAANINVDASKIDDLKKQKQEQEEKKETLEKKAASTEEYIREIDSKITGVSEKLRDTNVKLDKTQKGIETAKKELKEAEKSVNEQYESMKLRIAYMYENGDTQLLDLLFNSESVTEFLNKAEYISEVSKYDRNMLTKFKNTRQKIADTKTKLEKDEKQLLTLQKDQQTQKANLENLSSSKQAELSGYEQQIEQAEASAKNIDAEIAQQQAAIEAAIEAEKKREAEERRRQQQAQQQTQAPAQQSSPQTAQPTQQPSGNGSWGWPLPGHTSISSNYGDTDGRSSGHNGIDIPAPSGTAIVAAASGTVAWANYSSSAGNWVGVTHSNGVTSVYMHMSSIGVSAGQHVSQGQYLGAVGNTGYSFGNHLHFGVTVGTLPGNWVNPWNYL